MTMPKRSRLLRILKWTGVVFCVLLLGSWVCVTITPFFCHVDPYLVACHGGQVQIFLTAGRATLPTTMPHDFAPLYATGGLRDGLVLPSVRTLGLFGFDAVVPFWPPFSLVLLLTILLFWRDRPRTLPGHCQRCGYNLTGNVSGKCSECGEPCEPEATAT